MILQIDSNGFWGYISSVFQLIGNSMTLNEGTILALISDPHAGQLVVGIFIVLIISLALGQSTILFINQVPPRRFILSLVVSALIQGASIFLWAVASWGTALLVTGSDHMVYSQHVIWIFVLGHAPLALGVFSLMPYVGVFWPNFLRAWSMLCIGAAFVGMNFNVPRALMISTIGFAATLLFYRLMRPLLGRMNKWAWLYVSGVDKRYANTSKVQFPSGHNSEEGES